jgi:hypothetical protein
MVQVPIAVVLSGKMLEIWNPMQMFSHCFFFVVVDIHLLSENKKTIHKLGMVMHLWNPSTQEAKAGGL